MTAAWADPTAQGWVVRVKAVPGSSRNRVQGPLGDHLKIQVAAPPEGGKANAAIQELLAGLFSTSSAQVRLLAGGSNPRKRFAIDSGRFPSELDGD